jgi:hypothetical protein
MPLHVHVLAGIASLAGIAFVANGAGAALPGFWRHRLFPLAFPAFIYLAFGIFGKLPYATAPEVKESIPASMPKVDASIDILPVVSSAPEQISHGCPREMFRQFPQLAGNGDAESGVADQRP